MKTFWQYYREIKRYYNDREQANGHLSFSLLVAYSKRALFFRPICSECVIVSSLKVEVIEIGHRYIYMYIYNDYFPTC